MPFQVRRTRTRGTVESLRNGSQRTTLTHTGVPAPADGRGRAGPQPGGAGLVCLRAPGRVAGADARALRVNPTTPPFLRGLLRLKPSESQEGRALGIAQLRWLALRRAANDGRADAGRRLFRAPHDAAQHMTAGSPSPRQSRSTAGPTGPLLFHPHPTTPQPPGKPCGDASKEEKGPAKGVCGMGCCGGRSGWGIAAT